VVPKRLVRPAQHTALSFMDFFRLLPTSFA